LLYSFVEAEEEQIGLIRDDRMAHPRQNCRPRPGLGL